MIYITIIVVLIILIGIINCLDSNNKKIFMSLLDPNILINSDSISKNNIHVESLEKLKQEKIIVQFKDSQYDITNFAKKHPGGKTVLMENNGKDIEKLMIENEHSENAYKLLEKYILK